MRDEKRQKLIERLGDRLPEEQRTEFNMDRWLESYDENVDQCEKVIIEYLKNRKSLGLDQADAFKGFYSRADVKNVCEIFPQSKLQKGWINDKDNGVVFVEAGIADPSKAAKLVRAGDYLRTFFAFLEHMLHLILEQEKLTGKRSWAVCIFDMQNVSLLQWANPFGPINRAFEARVSLAMAYYAEMLSKVVIVNPPRFLGLLFKIMSFLLPFKILNRFHIAPNFMEMQKWISPDAIPIGFGGQKRVEDAQLPVGYDPPKQFGKDQFLRDGTVWEQHSIKTVNYGYHTLSAGGSFVRELEAKGGQKLVYEYFANRDFTAKLENQNGDFLMPFFRLCTPVLAEEGTVQIAEDTTRIRLEITNLSRMMKMKLRIALLLIE